MEILEVSKVTLNPALADAREKAKAKALHLATEVAELRKATTDAKNELQKANSELKKLHDVQEPPASIRNTPYLWYVVQGDNVVWYRLTGGYGEAHPKEGRQYVPRHDVLAVANAAVAEAVRVRPAQEEGWVADGDMFYR